MTSPIRRAVGGTAHIENVGSLGFYPSLSQARDAIKHANAVAGKPERHGWIEASDGRVIPIRSKYWKRAG